MKLCREKYLRYVRAQATDNRGHEVSHRHMILVEVNHIIHYYLEPRQSRSERYRRGVLLNLEGT